MFPKTQNSKKTNTTVVISSENFKHYFYFIGCLFYSIQTRCPYCKSNHLIRWGYYWRYCWPMTEKQKIQRIRCKVCGRTTNLLPSFLLAQKSFKVSVLEELINLLLKHSQDWKKLPNLPVDVSTIYLWLRRFKEQIHVCLPLLREKLLTLQPGAPVTPKSAPNGLISDVELFKQFLNVAQSLHQTTVSLANRQQPHQTNLFSFLNYFFAQHTGKALLEI